MDFDKTGRYRGDIVNCRKDGTGRYVYPGDVYVYDGPWVDGEKHGKNAQFSLPGYSEYSGDFNHGEITGKGKKVWADGRTYEGDWEAGEMYGKGCWKSSDGLEIYEGGFANNKREGNGTLVLRNGDRYTGEFHLHKFHGRGSYLRENVVFLESDFENGGISGKCQIQWHKIATYIGECQENKLHGRGYYRSFDGSYETETTFNNSLPEYNVNGYDLKIDRSMCVEDVIDPKGKDKKKEKEKKKPAGKKGSSVMDVESMISISPGDPIGLIAISLHFKGIDKSPTGLPNSDELRRALSVSLREYTPQTSTEHPDAGLGEVVPIWRRNPTLEEYAVAWERFPPNSFRFINGVNPLTGDSVGFEGMSEFTSLHDPSTKVISTLLKSSIPNKLRITAPVQTFRAKNPQLSFLLDFKLIPSANLMSEENSPLRSVRYNDINYRSIVILSWSLVLDNASVFSLCLLVPNPVETTWKNCYWELCSNDVALCRWVENQIFDVNSWHSIGLSLFLDGDSLSQVKSNLYVDGDGRMRLIEGDDPSLQEFLLTEDTERVWQVGGEAHAAIDALIKNFALFSECDHPNLQEMTSCYTAWSALQASASHPSISESEDSVAIPPNHTLITSLEIMSCGGKAIIPPYLVLPTSLSGGYYVLEVQDMTDERCRQRLDGKPSSGAGDDYANMYSIVPPSHSSKSLFKISVT